MRRVQGWLDYLDLSDKSITELEKAGIYSIDSLMSIEERIDTDLLTYKDEVQEVIENIRNNGLYKTKRWVSFKAVEYLDELDYSAALDKEERKYLSDQPISEEVFGRRLSILLNGLGFESVLDVRIKPAQEMELFTGVGTGTVYAIRQHRKEIYERLKFEGIPDTEDKDALEDKIIRHIAGRFYPVINTDANEVRKALDASLENAIKEKSEDELTAQDYLRVMECLPMSSEHVGGFIESNIRFGQAAFTWSELKKEIMRFNTDEVVLDAIRLYCVHTFKLSGEYILVQRPYMRDCLDTFKSDRNGQILLDWLNGKTGAAIAKDLGISSSRVQQIVRHEYRKRTPLLMEDYYFPVVERFEIPRNVLCKVFPDLDDVSVKYIYSRYSGGYFKKAPFDIKNVLEYKGIFRDELIRFCNAQIDRVH